MDVGSNDDRMDEKRKTKKQKPFTDEEITTRPFGFGIMSPSKCAVNLFTFYRYAAHKTAEKKHIQHKILDCIQSILISLFFGRQQQQQQQQRCDEQLYT